MDVVEKGGRKFSPGFRLSGVDVAVLVVGAVAVVGMAFVDGWLASAVGFVVGHFFLFCNVLRMSRMPELIWAVVFAVMAMDVVLFEEIAWLTAFGVSAGLTAVLAVIEMRRASYHGVGWRWVNPGLPQWWEKHETLRQ